jgi:hypothetical protein
MAATLRILTALIIRNAARDQTLAIKHLASHSRWRRLGLLRKPGLRHDSKAPANYFLISVNQSDQCTQRQGFSFPGGGLRAFATLGRSLNLL